MCRIMGEASPRLFILFLALVFTGNLFAAEVSDDGVWQRADERKIAVSVAGDSKPRAYRALTLNREILQNVLRQAPLEFSSAARTSNVVLSLPLPDGSFSRYRIEESPVIAPELAAQFPQIKTYRGQSIDDPFGVVRFGWTEGGFHAIGFSEHDAFAISVLEEGDTGHYISYWNADSSATPVQCLTQEHETMVQDSSIPSVALVSGSTLRTYTVAIGATGEYTKKFGGTQSGALNDGIVPAINSVNAILEREFAIRLVVSGEQMKTIYTDATTDPYSGTNSDKAAQNQANLDSVIGSADYDIGHVFNGDGGSGLARLGSVCGSSKAWAISTSYQPKDISFIVELVAHEMGHQFSAHHSFNGTTTNCANRNASTAWEPASGSTIMSYSGSCSGENLQAFSDPYYHVGNYDQVMSLVGGLSCDTETSTGNNPPTVNAGPDYTIPQSTPFTLTATGNDADGDPLSYSWEEWDLGAPSPPSTDDGSRPIFRSFAPVTSPSRTFPKLSDILSNKATLGESLPTTDRVLKLRVTARDNRASGGGVANDMTVITVENNAGPFQVTSPNSAVTWNAGAQTITWNVAGTNVSPISTANVSILLSTDGGLTFPTTLAGSTPNDGTHTVTIPNVATSTARVKVAAVGNIFFDISNTNFTIGSGGCTPITLSPSSLGAGEVGTPYNQTISASGGTGPYSFAKTSGTLPTGLTLGGGGTLSGTPSAAGTFNFTVTSTDDNDCTGNKSYSINVTSVACSPITLSPSSLGAGEVGTPYNQTISASGGTAPYSFAKTSGTLPTGLTLGGGGTLSGTPSTAGTFNFTVTSTDDNDCTGNKSYSINVTSVACSPITLSPSSLGAGEVGTPYNQTISASGGTAPYSFAKTSGTLPTGLTLGGGGTLSGTPSAAGTFNFTVTSTDDNDCTGNKSYSINVTIVNTCLFCDDFEDNVLSTAWTYSESAWSETGGRLVGTSPKKAMALATPAFDGCSNCTVESQMRTSGGEGNRVWMFAWYVDKSNSVELLMKEESDMWILKQKWNGSSAKAKAKVQINPGVSYTARISFDGSQFRVFVNNTLVITMPKLMGSSPNGTVGFQTKGTTASIGKIEVK